MREPAGGRNAVVIEDDPSISELLRLYLSREGYVVHATALGETGATLVRDTDPALVVLDLMLPDGSGFDVLKAVRAFSQAPVIILTARDAEQDKILGLELGADDYMVKPFSPGELVARARAVQRRMAAQDDQAAVAQVLGGIELLPAERTVRVDGALVDLTPKEFELLHYPAGEQGSGADARSALGGSLGLQRLRGRSYCGRPHRPASKEARWVGTSGPDGLGAGIQGRSRGGRLSRAPSIRLRLIGALAGVSLFTLVVVGAVFYLFLGGYVVERQKEQLLDQAVVVAEQVQSLDESLPERVAGTRVMTALLRSDLRALPSGAGIAVFRGSDLVARVGAIPGGAQAQQRLRVQADELGGAQEATAVIKAEAASGRREIAVLLAAAPIVFSDGARGSGRRHPGQSRRPELSARGPARPPHRWGDSHRACRAGGLGAGSLDDPATSPAVARRSEASRAARRSSR